MNVSKFKIFTVCMKELLQQKSQSHHTSIDTINTQIKTSTPNLQNITEVKDVNSGHDAHDTLGFILDEWSSSRLHKTSSQTENKVSEQFSEKIVSKKLQINS